MTDIHAADQTQTFNIHVDRASIASRPKNIQKCEINSSGTSLCRVVTVVAPKFEDSVALRSREYGPDGSENDTSDETAIVGDTVRLHCIVHAVPEPQITWYQ